MIENGRKDNPSSKPFINVSEIKEHRDNSGLLQYLLAQDMESVKFIQTVMYIGRDYRYESEDEYNIRMELNYEDPDNLIEAPLLRSRGPEKLLSDWLANSSGVSEWKDKYVEVGQIYQKVPLDQYLDRAFMILGLS